MIEIESEEGKHEQLRRGGVTKLTAHLLLSPDLVEDSEDRALKFAETIGAFAENPLEVEMEGRNEVKASLEMEGGKLHIFFRPDCFKLSFRNKKGTASYNANFPVKEIQLKGPFLSFVLDDGETVRAVKENGTISIDHFAFGLYPI